MLLSRNALVLARRPYEVTTIYRARPLARPDLSPQCFVFLRALSSSSSRERAMTGGGRDYSRWTRESLVKRVKRLEEELGRAEPSNPALAGAPPSPPLKAAAEDDNDGTTSAAAPPNGGKKSTRRAKRKERRAIDPAKYSTRLIALKLAYLGKNYNGFEHQSSASVPTIEEELWKALVKSCLIFPDKPEEVNFGPWEYSKCGRTDRGVSAFGQVITIRVRSSGPKDAGAEAKEKADAQGDGGSTGNKPAWDPIADEIPYCRVLNRLLPRDIRALAWCANPPPGFSARFSCRERQYRYFFTQPAFAPMPSELEGARQPGSSQSRRIKDGWLDIEAMRAAAKRFEGVHDFRNFCKVDPGKQITNFERKMFEADIVRVDDVHSAAAFLNRPEFRPDDGLSRPLPEVYYFHVRGSAFLWHQIRHMVAVLFAVGQGLEPPSVVSDLLDVTKQPRRPAYVMADEVPLVLWDCVFPDLDESGNSISSSDDGTNMKDTVDWIWLGEDSPLNLHGPWGLVDDLWESWREKKMDELLANRLLDMASTRADTRRRLLPVSSSGKLPDSHRAFEGGNTFRSVGRYVPVLEKPLLPAPSEANDKWAQSKGFASAEEMTKTKNWRSTLKAARDGSVGEGEGDADATITPLAATDNRSREAVGGAGVQS